MVALEVPLNVTVAPLPADVGLIVPEMLQEVGAPVKLTPVMLAPDIVSAWLGGVNA